MPCQSTNPKGWCPGPTGFGNKCLDCQSPTKIGTVVGTPASPGPGIGAPPVHQVPGSVPGMAPIAGPVAVPPVAPIGGTQAFGAAPPPSAAASQKSTIADELAQLRAAQAAKGRVSMMIDGGWAYRGVGSDPEEYERRGGFTAWNIPDIGTARQTLKRLINASNPTNGLSGACYRWQAAKNQTDGFFLSTGTNAHDAYDTYPFVYRINVSPLRLCQWDKCGATVNAACVEDCHLYLDGGTIDTSNFIAIICLAQGKARIYELLIMSPCAPGICEVRISVNAKEYAYLNFDTWKAKYGGAGASAAETTTTTGQ